MSGFVRTREAAEVFSKLLSCAKCGQESDNLQTMGTACKHAFCWDCINLYSSANTFVLCPRCSCPLEVSRPKAATVFNNLAQHINEFKLLLDEYERCLRNEGASAATTIAQTQLLLQAHDATAVIEVSKEARKEAVDEFISTQRFMDVVDEKESKASSPASDFSEELNVTPPPTNATILNASVSGEKFTEPRACPSAKITDEDFSNDDVTVTPIEDGIISDSVPQFGRPVMTSTQRPCLFLSQAVHARNELFQPESSLEPIKEQKPKIYHEETTYNFFKAKPAATFDKRGDTKADAPWLDLPPKRRRSKVKVETPEQAAYVLPSTPSDDKNFKTPRRGPKVEASPSRPRSRSSFSGGILHPHADDPVMEAVLGGDLDQVNREIDNGHDVNQRDLEKRTPLFIAVGMKRLDICRALVERGGAIINANCGSECNTALHIAVSQESEEIVKYLLSKGASKTIRNIRQQTPSQLAQSRSPLRSLVEKYRSHPRQLGTNVMTFSTIVVPRLPDVHIVCFSKKVKASLTFAEQAALERIMTVVPICDEETTHYVVALDAEGVAAVDDDLLKAMLQNTRIMSVAWLHECIQENKALPHLHYEVSKLRYMENDVVVNSLERCRKSKEKMEPALFHGCVFYLLLNKYTGIHSRRLLPDLIRLGGGEVAVSEPHYKMNAPAPFHAPNLSSPIFVVYDVTMTSNIPEKFHHPDKYNLVTAQWIIESVIEYDIKPIA